MLDSRKTFFTAIELARALGVSRARVYQLLDAGKIEPPAVRIGRAHAFTAEQVVRIMEQRSSATS